MVMHTTETLLGLVPVAAATGIATRTMRSIGGGGGRRRASMPKRKKVIRRKAPVRRAVARKAPVKTVRRPATSSRPLGKGWVQLSRAEIVRLIGARKADAVKANAGHAVKHGTYDKFIYHNGSYYIGTAD